MKPDWLAVYECYGCEHRTHSVITQGEIPVPLCSMCEDESEEKLSEPLGRLIAFCVECGAEHYPASDDFEDEDYENPIRCQRCSVVLRDRSKEE